MTNATKDPILEKVGKLVKLAASADEEEARTAAVQATRLMKEHELVLLPKSELDRLTTVIGEARALAKAAEKEKMTNMAIGALAGALIGPKFLKL